MNATWTDSGALISKQKGFHFFKKVAFQGASGFSNHAAAERLENRLLEDRRNYRESQQGK